MFRVDLICVEETLLDLINVTRKTRLERVCNRQKEEDVDGWMDGGCADGRGNNAERDEASGENVRAGITVDRRGGHCYQRRVDQDLYAADSRMARASDAGFARNRWIPHSYTKKSRETTVGKD